MEKFFSSKISCSVVGAIITIYFLAVGLMFLAVKHIRFESGGYSIEQVILSNDLEHTQPVADGITFQPADTIYCTVRTEGVDGIVGMRWFHGNEMVSESIGKTKNNLLTSYIKSDSADGLPEGSYHVEVFIIENKPIQKIYFEVKSQLDE